MAMKKLLLIVLLGCLVATQNWISEVKPQTLDNNLQKQVQGPVEQSQPMVEKDEAQRPKIGEQDEYVPAKPENREKQPRREDERYGEMQQPRNPFDRSGFEKPMHPDAKRYQSMSDQQLMQQMRNMKDLERRREHRGRGPRKEFKRKPENHMHYEDRMPMYCMIGLTVVSSALLCCCVKKCRKHSKKSMEKMMRRREMARFQQVQPSVQQMPVHCQNIPAAVPLTVDQKIRYHEIELEKLKLAYEQRNQGYYENHSIPVGQPVSQGNLIRANDYRY